MSRSDYQLKEKSAVRLDNATQCNAMRACSDRLIGHPCGRFEVDELPGDWRRQKAFFQPRRRALAHKYSKERQARPVHGMGGIR